MGWTLVTTIKGDQGIQGEPGPQGLPGVNAVPADTAVAGYISTTGTSETQTAADARYAPLPGLTRNGLTGWYHADGYGAIDDGVTDNTAVLQGMIDGIIAAGGGKLYLPLKTSGIYLFDHLNIVGYQQAVNLTIEGVPGVVLYANPASTSDAIVIDSTAALGGQYTRGVTFKNLHIQGNAVWSDGAQAIRRGVLLRRCQDVTFEDATISHFERGALTLQDAWDNMFVNMQIMWSGIANSDTDYAYGLTITATDSNSNANKFVNLHMEFCPLIVLVDASARLNVFTNGKIEHGGDSRTNGTTKSPIWIKQGIDTTFVGFNFTSNKNTGNIPFIQSDLNTDPYVSAYHVPLRTYFDDCTFFAPSASTTCRWFNGYNTTFDNSNFGSSNGGTGGYIMSLYSGNRVRNCDFTYLDTGVNTFAMRGTENVIEDNVYVTSGAGDVGSLYTIFTGAANSRIAGNRVKGNLANRITASIGNYLGSISVLDAGTGTQQYAGGGIKDVFGIEVVKLTDASAATYTNFVHAFNGQKLMLYATTANVTIAHNTATIILKGGVNKTLAINETMNLVMVDGVWYQV